MNHTLDYGEPWKATHVSRIEDRDDYWQADTRGNDRRDRILACVNACAGMADPAEEIAKLKTLRWVPLSERKPTAADASEFGDLEWSDGKSIWECRFDDPEKATHWRRYVLP